MKRCVRCRTLTDRFEPERNVCRECRSAYMVGANRRRRQRRRAADPSESYVQQWIHQMFMVERGLLAWERF